MAAAELLLKEKHSFFALFPEVCLGFYLGLKKQSKSLNGREKRDFYYLANAKNSELCFELGLLYAAGDIVPQDDQKVVHYFHAIKRNRLFVEMGCNVPNLMACAKFIQRISDNALQSILKRELCSIILSLGDHAAIAKSMACSIYLSGSKYDLELVNILISCNDLQNSREFFMNFNFWLKELSNLWRDPDEKKFFLNQIKDFDSKRPQSELERYLLDFDPTKFPKTTHISII